MRGKNDCLDCAVPDEKITPSGKRNLGAGVQQRRGRKRQTKTMMREGKEGESSSPSSSYSLKPIRFFNEDILFCIDVDLQSQVEMKVLVHNGRPITRLDSIKQAILLFINAKLAINPDHRFSFATLGQSVTWYLYTSKQEVFITKAPTAGSFRGPSYHSRFPACDKLLSQCACKQGCRS